MEPMKPMEPIEPFPAPEAWWPGDLGQPASSGTQNGVRYAFFPGAHRLVIERDGQVTMYDSGNHRISGVSQRDSEGQSLAFTSQNGSVKLDTLRRIA